jgi:ADP-ribose pyrophosphatase YjhB (NUDIX family)
MKYPLSYEEFQSIYSKVTRLCVEVIVKTENGIVLSRRSIEPWKGLWHIPGGTVYMGEDLVDSVKRVALDELGVSVEIDKLLGYITYPSIKSQKDSGWAIGIAFLTHITSGELRGSYQGEEVAEFKDLPENTLQEQKDFILKEGLL